MLVAWYHVRFFLLRLSCDGSRFITRSAKRTLSEGLYFTVAQSTHVFDFRIRSDELVLPNVKSEVLIRVLHRRIYGADHVQRQMTDRRSTELDGVLVCGAYNTPWHTRALSRCLYRSGNCECSISMLRSRSVLIAHSLAGASRAELRKSL